MKLNQMIGHLNQTIETDMASLVQEQLLDISILYQRLQFKSENHSEMIGAKDIYEKKSNLSNSQADGDNPSSTPCVASFRIAILPWKRRLSMGQTWRGGNFPGLKSKPTRFVRVNVGVRPTT